MTAPRVALALLLLLAGAPVGSQEAADGLRHNPFLRPMFLRPRPAQEAVPKPAAAAPLPEPPWEPRLRGTLVCGAGSVANVEGTVVAVGEELAGRRLVEVREGEAIFERAGVRLLLSTDGTVTRLPGVAPGAERAAANSSAAEAEGRRR